MNNLIKELSKCIELKEKHLFQFGFKRARQNEYWLDMPDKDIELSFADGFFHPVLVEYHAGGDIVNRVSLSPIKYVHELEMIYLIFTGKELKALPCQHEFKKLDAGYTLRCPHCRLEP